MARAPPIGEWIKAGQKAFVSSQGGAGIVRHLNGPPANSQVKKALPEGAEDAWKDPTLVIETKLIK